MSTISISNIADGDAVTASSINNQVNTIVNDYNGNITAANLASNAVTDAKITANNLLASKFSNPYKFHVTQTVAITINTTATKMSYTSKLFDTDTNFDAATNYTFTAPVAGFYFFYAYTRMSGAGSATSANMDIYKNGAAFTRLAETQGTNVLYGLTGSISMQLALNDTINIYAATSGASVSTFASGTNVSYFGGYLISSI